MPKSDTQFKKGHQHSKEVLEKISASRKGKGLGNTHGFKKGDKHRLGIPSPWVKDNPQIFKKGMIPWNKGLKTGIKPPNWKGGISTREKQFKDSFVYRDWRKLVFLCDNFTCQKCRQVGDKLQAHHILNFISNPELRVDVRNGITLCLDCHSHFHKKYGFNNNTREQLEDYLKL